MKSKPGAAPFRSVLGFKIEVGDNKSKTFKNAQKIIPLKRHMLSSKINSKTKWNRVLNKVKLLPLFMEVQKNEGKKKKRQSEIMHTALLKADHC